MHPAVAVLLKRILPLLAGASVAQRADAFTEGSAAKDVSLKDTPQLQPRDEAYVQKLIFGTARAGHAELLAHRSHSSHSSHRSHSSHSSHSSHYSGSSGYTQPAPSRAPAPSAPPPQPSTPPTASRPAPAPKPPKIIQPTPKPVVVDLTPKVLAKLPKIRSKWPAEVEVTKLSEFTIFEGDKPVGVFNIRPGLRVKVIEVKLEHALIRVGPNQSPIPVLNTDLINRMGGAEKILALPDDPEPKKDSAGEKKS